MMNPEDSWVAKWQRIGEHFLLLLVLELPSASPLLLHLLESDAFPLLNFKSPCYLSIAILDHTPARI